MKNKEVIKRSLVVILVLLGSIMIFFLGVQLFWGLSMGRKEVYPSSPEEDLFIENLEEKTNLWIMYFPLPKGNTIQDINIRKKGYTEPNITINKDNIKTFSDSVFTEFMKVYSLKKKLIVYL